ncbi:hypothetical protein A1O3_00628 [Capronia epimyces CBS 606.96]|uniref:MARVEL domain-containing protein n=1 Tax=Capronia epimyces CBS 606.96 TaxID=1182542 RepID=W9YHQ4_9EURO|nr:uncharacterized protein A1O3_00628 [Capronia epimyces CBS 606.96]EXJ92078.1 hypothetical protein A1O3_00628 [Capronia epimyces CBS 606.96]
MAFNARPRGWALPGWIPFLRIAQGVLALLILILTAVAASKLLGGADTSFLVTPYPGFGFAWFAFSWTIVYVPIATLLLPNLNPRVKPLIIILVLELLTTLWWLVTFALLADNSSSLASILNTSFTNAKTAVGLTQASAVFGAVEL